jgi:hypothetical protein
VRRKGNSTSQGKVFMTKEELIARFGSPEPVLIDVSVGKDWK